MLLIVSMLKFLLNLAPEPEPEPEPEMAEYRGSFLCGWMFTIAVSVESMHLAINQQLSLCLPVYLPFNLSACLSVCLSTCLSASPLVCLPVCPFAYLSLCLSDRLPTCLPACLSICLPVCLYMYVSCLPAYPPVCLSIWPPAYNMCKIQLPACLQPPADMITLLLYLETYIGYLCPPVLTLRYFLFLKYWMVWVPCILVNC